MKDVPNVGYPDTRVLVKKPAFSNDFEITVQIKGVRRWTDPAVFAKEKVKKIVSDYESGKCSFSQFYQRVSQLGGCGKTFATCLLALDRMLQGKTTVILVYTDEDGGRLLRVFKSLLDQTFGQQAKLFTIPEVMYVTEEITCAATSSRVIIKRWESSYAQSNSSQLDDLEAASIFVIDIPHEKLSSKLFVAGLKPLTSTNLIRSFLDES